MNTPLRVQVLSQFKVGELSNPITFRTVREKLEQSDMFYRLQIIGLRALLGIDQVLINQVKKMKKQEIEFDKKAVAIIGKCELCVKPSYGVVEVPAQESPKDAPHYESWKLCSEHYQDYTMKEGVFEPYVE